MEGQGKPALGRWYPGNKDLHLSYLDVIVLLGPALTERLAECCLR